MSKIVYLLYGFLSSAVRTVEECLDLDQSVSGSAARRPYRTDPPESGPQRPVTSDMAVAQTPLNDRNAIVLGLSHFSLNYTHIR